MNNLHRELAPISDAAWADIEEKRRVLSSVTSPDGAWSTYTDPAASACPPSAPATCGRSQRPATAFSRDSAG